MPCSALYRNHLKVLLLLSGLSVSFLANTADYYQVVDLGHLGGNGTHSFSINEANEIVGDSSGEDFSYHAFIYRDSIITDLGVLPLPDEDLVSKSYAFANNANSIVAGSSIHTIFDDVANDDDREIFVAVYYDTVNGTINAVPQFDPSNLRDAGATDINDNDVIVGYANWDDPDDVDSNDEPVVRLLSRGFVYDINADQLTMIKPLDADSNHLITLRSINNNGYIVGGSTVTVDDRLTEQVIAVNLDSPDIVEQLEIFGGIFQQAWSVNDAGKVVGKARAVDSFDIQGFVYDSVTGEATGLGFLNENFPFTEAMSINNDDLIVGTSRFQHSNVSGTTDIFHAFIYENDTLKDLNNLIGCETGWRLDEARDINDSGVIVGNGLHDGFVRAFMLIPQQVAAPSCGDEDGDKDSGSLTVLGLIMLALLRRKRVLISNGQV